jgi:hypothetical protein
MFFKHRFILIIILGLLLVACTTNNPANPGSAQSAPTTQAPSGTSATAITPEPEITPTLVPQVTPQPATEPVPTTQTSCPTAGTARAAVLPTLALGNTQRVIYFYNVNGASSTAYLRSYNTATAQKTNILIFQNSQITEGQLSWNGQWIMFTRILGRDQSALQIVRLDGQGLQTLYCSSGSNANGNRALYSFEWSPDQRWVAFTEIGTDYHPTMKMLDMQTGQLFISLTGSPNATPRAWLDNTHLYVESLLYGSDQLSGGVYVLDTTVDHTQTLSTLPKVADTVAGSSDFDSTATNSGLFVSRHQGNSQIGSGNTVVGPSTITVRPVLGGAEQTILNTPLAISSVRAVTAHTLLLTVASTLDKSQNGIWRVSPDGKDLIKLAGTTGEQTPTFNSNSQYPASTMSSDGHFSFEVRYPDGAKGLLISSLVGDPPKTFAEAYPKDNLSLIGWTTL